MQVIGEDCHARELSDRPSSGKVGGSLPHRHAKCYSFCFPFQSPIFFLLLSNSMKGEDKCPDPGPSRALYCLECHEIICFSVVIYENGKDVY